MANLRRGDRVRAVLGNLPAAAADRPGVLAIAAFTVVLALFFRRFLFEGLAPGGSDLQNYALANLTHLYAALADGRLPLWDPYRLLGVPFLANPQTAVLYPVNLALSWAEPIAVLTSGLVLHTYIAGLGMMAFCRRALRTGWLGALVGAMAFALGGYLAARMGLPNQLAVLAWLPLILLCVDRLLARPQLTTTAILAVLFALQYLAGHPQAQYISLALTGLYLTARIFRISIVSGAEALPGLARALGAFVVAAALGLGLSAAQLLPGLTLRSLSLRAEGLPIWHQNAFALPKELIGSALLPTFVERPFSEEFVSYVGVITILLAALALLDKQRRFEGFLFLGLSVLGVWIALGLTTPLFGLLSDELPGFDQFRVPARWLLLTTFSLSALAAIGTDRAVHISRATWYAGAGRALALIGAAIFVLAFTSWGTGAVSDLTLVAWLAAAAAGFITLRNCASGEGLARIGLPVLVAAELLLAQQPLDMNKLAIPPDAYTEPGPVVERLERGPSAPRTLSIVDVFYSVDAQRFQQEIYQPFQHYGPTVLDAYATVIKNRDSLSPNQSSAFSVPSADGFDGGLLPLGSYVAYRDRFLEPRPGKEDSLLQHEFVIRGQFPSPQLLSALGTSVVIADDYSDVRTQDPSGQPVAINSDASVAISAGGRLNLRVDPPASIDSLALAVRTSASGPLATVMVAGESDTVVDAGFLDGLGTPIRTNKAATEVGPLASPDSAPAILDSVVEFITLPTPNVISSLAVSAEAPLEILGLALIDGDSIRSLPLAGLTADKAGIVSGPTFQVDEIGSLRIYRQLLPEPPAVLMRGGFPVINGATVISAAAERVVIAVEDGGGNLVLRQTYYGGWQAFIGEEAVEVNPADEMFLSVEVPVDASLVRFEYEEPRLMAGTIVAGVAGVLTVLLFAAGLWRSRRRHA